MKNINILVATVFAVLVMASCNKSDSDPGPSQKELVLEALGGTWTIDAAASSFGNAPVDVGAVTVSFTETGFTLGGDVTQYVSGGSYVIGDDGAITSVNVTIASEDLALDGTPSLALNAAQDQVTIRFNTVEAGPARTNGLGAYTIVFTKS